MSKKTKIIFIIIGMVLVIAAIVVVALLSTGALGGSIQENEEGAGECIKAISNWFIR